jgi:hypothetical protein
VQLVCTAVFWQVGTVFGSKIIQQVTFFQRSKRVVSTRLGSNDCWWIAARLFSTRSDHHEGSQKSIITAWNTDSLPEAKPAHRYQQPAPQERCPNLLIIPALSICARTLPRYISYPYHHTRILPDPNLPQRVPEVFELVACRFPTRNMDRRELASLHD